ncbi:MAG: CoA transferase [Desulfobacterales bacterium]|jgi:crotonobetainyl-CoA:carnitine CoA-transferase CaiB-like acyl-CoA transferase|nr:CoA transferase [Desulfobacterales bacterium]
MTKKGALDGIVVLDMSRLLPGPFCSMVLADHGARVIAIEDKRFAGEFGLTSTIYRNKEHISLNLKSEAGREIFLSMARKADIIIEQFRPGVVQRLGVDYDSIVKINPKIIYCSITGYGQTGPYRDIAGHDVNYLSVAGVLDLIGVKDGSPCIPGFQIADIAGGGMYAIIGILMALHAREKTGKGQYIDISMTDGSASLLALVLSISQAFGQPLKRSDSLLSHRYACYNVYETADSRYITIGAVENRFWKNLCDYFNVPEFTSLQYDDSRRQEMINFMSEQFKKKTLSQWEKELFPLDICWGAVKTYEEALASSLLKEREMVIEMTNNDGRKLLVLGTPLKMSDTPGSVRTWPPDFGENTKQVLMDFGYSDEQIQVFSAKGII